MAQAEYSTDFAGFATPHRANIEATPKYLNCLSFGL